MTALVAVVLFSVFKQPKAAYIGRPKFYALAGLCYDTKRQKGK